MRLPDVPTPLVPPVPDAVDAPPEELPDVLSPEPEPFVYDPELQEVPTTLEHELKDRGADDWIANVAAQGPGDVKVRIFVKRTGYELRVQLLIDSQEDERVAQADLWLPHGTDVVDWHGLWVEPEYQGRGWLSHLGPFLLMAWRDLGKTELVVNSWSEELLDRLHITGIDRGPNLTASLVEGRMAEYFDFKAGLRPEPAWRRQLRAERESRMTP